LAPPPKTDSPVDTSSTRCSRSNCRNQVFPSCSSIRKSYKFEEIK
jgi:hypothetical protein